MVKNRLARSVSVFALLVAIVVVAPRCHSQTLEWTRQFGTVEEERPGQLSTDGLGNVYLSGLTYGRFAGRNDGSLDVYIAKYATDGTLAWKRQLGNAGEQQGVGSAADSQGNVFVSGYTTGSGGTSAGGFDAFVAKYDGAGNPQWTRQLGTSAYEQASDVSADDLGNVYLSGTSTGSIGGPTRDTGTPSSQSTVLLAICSGQGNSAQPPPITASAFPPTISGTSIWQGTPKGVWQG